MRSLASIVLVAWMAGASAAVQAYPLASGSLPEVSFIRVGAALIVCIAATIAAAVLLRNRMALGKSIGRNGLFGQAVRTRRLSAVEVLRITVQSVAFSARLNASFQICSVPEASCTLMSLIV